MAQQDPVDWQLAIRVGARLANRKPALTDPQLGEQLNGFVGTAEELVAMETGLRSANGPAVAKVVDRAEWVIANVASFRRLMRPMLDKWSEKLSGRGDSVISRAPLAVSRRIAGVELGMLLGWVSSRVLGQYDLLVADDDPTAQDVVYIVGPNLLQVEQKFGFPPDEFRLWIALHECTHRAQFTGVPWMRQHFLSLVEQAMSIGDPTDPGELFATLRRAVQDRADTRQKMQEGGMMAVLAKPEQQQALAQIGGMMSLLEGHGDVTMDRAGAGLIPSAPRFSRVLSERRQQLNPLSRLVQRVTGLEAKLNQYVAGERFIEAIEAVGGTRIIDRCWEAPAALPTLPEIRRPALWLERMAVDATIV